MGVTAWDLFAKAEEDVRIRTRTGGLITVLCCLVTMILVVGEFCKYHHVQLVADLVVDRDHHRKLDFYIDVVFANMPCEALTMDVMDDSGQVQLDLGQSQLQLTRLDSLGNVVGETSSQELDTDLPDSSPTEEGFCGSCYGAVPQTEDNKVCCQTCDDVRKAYLKAGWAFFDGKGIEQCEREGHVERLRSRVGEGCHIVGTASLNKIHGNIHFAPGPAFENRHGHFHDTSFYDSTERLDFSHVIRELRFGPQPANAKMSFTDSSAAGNADQQELIASGGHSTRFGYFAKVVPARFEDEAGHATESAETVVSGHVQTKDEVKAGSGRSIAGLFIDYEVSAMKVIRRQERGSFAGFVLSALTGMGGVLAIGSLVDGIIARARAA